MNFTKFKVTSEDLCNYDELLKLNICKYFKHDHFDSPEQLNAMQAIVKRNHDVLISMPEGISRSLCYQLPAVMQENKITIVFCPLQWIPSKLQHLRKHKIRARTPGINDPKKLLNDLKGNTPHTRFLYVSIQEAATESFQNVIKSLHQYDKLAYFVVEEAQCLFQRGEDCRNGYLTLGPFRTAYPSIPWIALTGITSKEMDDDIVEHLHLRKPIAWFKTPSGKIFRKNLYYDVVFKKFNANNFIHLKEYVTKCLGDINSYTNKNTKPCGIIHCRTDEICVQIASGLTKQGVTTMPHHDGLSSTNRQKYKLHWMAGEFPVICTTISFCEEIDKSSVRFVVHCGVPLSVASYYQESGQAGRDGRSSYCRIYYDKESVQTIDRNFKNEITNSSDGDRVKTQRDYDDFLKMCNYCETIACRHKVFSDYFQDVSPECINRCDVCKNPKEAQNALDFQLFSNNFFLAPIPDDLRDGKQSSAAESSCEYYDNGQPTNQSKNESNSFVQMQLAFLRSELESAESHIQMQPLPTWSRKGRAKTKAQTIKQKNLNLLGAFLKLHHHSNPPTVERSDETKISELALNEELHSLRQLDLHKFDVISRTSNGQHVKLEPPSLQSPSLQSPSLQSPSLQSPSVSSASCELFQMKIKRSRSISPTDTIIKEEVTNNLEASEYFEVSTRRRRTVSPAETVIKEENDVINECSEDASRFVIDNKTSLRNDLLGPMPRPPRNVSPAETIIKEEKIQPFSNNSVELFAPLIQSNIKVEPMIPISPTEWLSRLIPQPRNATQFYPQIDGNVSPTFIKREAVSPTGIIIKEERASPTNEIDSNYSAERQDDFLENISENSFPSCSPVSEDSIGYERSPIHLSRDRQRSKSDEINFGYSNIASSTTVWEGVNSHKREQDDIRRDEPSSLSEKISHKSESKIKHKDKRPRKGVLSSNDFANWDYEPARSTLISSDMSELKNIAINEKILAKLQPVSDRNKKVFHGHIKQIETKYQGQQMPLHLFQRLKEEKTSIAEVVKMCLMPYYQEGRIQPMDLFSIVARTISHIFYNRYADETMIKQYIDDLFKRIEIISSVTDLESNL